MVSGALKANSHVANCSLQWDNQAQFETWPIDQCSFWGSFRPWSLYSIGPWLIFPMLMSYSLTTNSLTLKRYSKAQILKPELKVQTNSLIYGLIPITWGSCNTIYRVSGVVCGFMFFFLITPYIITMTKKVTQDYRFNIISQGAIFWKSLI